MSMSRCLHHMDGRCNVTSAPKNLYMERNGSSPMCSSKVNFRLSMICQIKLGDISHDISNITSAYGFIVSLVALKLISMTYE